MIRANASVGTVISKALRHFQITPQSGGRRHLVSVKHQRRESPHAPGGTFMPDMSGCCPDRIRFQVCGFVDGVRIARLTSHRKDQRVCQYAHFKESYSSGRTQNGRKCV
jgi:hypothetical protein